MKKTIYFFLFHPAFLGLVLLFVIILFLPPVFDKYQAKIITTKVETEPGVYSLFDLDNDNISEEMFYHGLLKNYPTVIIRKKGAIIDQWNFKGQFIDSDFFSYCDYNADGIHEIFVFNINHDSIFISGINPFAVEEPPFYNKFVDKSIPYNGLYNCAFLLIDNPDLDNDGYREIVFAITTGISKQPRNLYLVDVKNDTVIKSPECGAALEFMVAHDINNDGYNEYFSRNCAFGNIHNDSIDFPDSCAYLMVFDKNMNFLFDPLMFGQYKTSLETRPFCPFETTYLTALQIHHGTENIDNKLMLFDIGGGLIKERTLGNIDGIVNSFLLTRDKAKYDDLFLFLNSNRIEKLDTNLQAERTLKIPGINHTRPVRLDLDLNGLDEFIFLKADLKGLVITRNDFSNPVTLEFENNTGIPSGFSIAHRGEESPLLHFQLGEIRYFAEYSKNPLYPIKYILWLGIYAFAFMFFYSLQKIQNIRAKRVFETQQEINALQLRSIKGQTDPHFTLNLLDSIGNLFYKRDSEKAAYVFGKYAKLLRTTILSTDKISVSLESEINYVKNYMDLERFRYDGNFDYTIQLDETIDTQIEVPKMLLHTFIENAIKHGLKHKKELGKLDISIKKRNKAAEVSIRDNGVGRQKAKEYSTLSTGKGLHILDDMLNLYFEIKKTRISYGITDLFTESGNAEGTLITINIPIKTKIK